MSNNIIHEDENTLIKRRREELEELTAKNFEPYAYSYEVDSYSASIKNKFVEGEEKNC